MDSPSSDTIAKAKAPSSLKQPRLIACRECHRKFRSKLRCDREYPCKSCVKRGCADICPNGILVKAKKNKNSTIDVAKLQETNDSLNDRIRQLEEALASAHARQSSESHPLLADRLFLSDPQGQNGVPAGRSNGELVDGPSTISAYGTLAIGSDGQATFHGAAANPGALLESEIKGSPLERQLNRSAEVASIPPEILELGRLFPFGTQTYSAAHASGLKGLLFKYLPPVDEAWNICQAWFDNGAWLNDPLPRPEFVQHILNPIYEASSSDSVSPDRLAVLFILLALGSLLDLRKSFDQPATEPLYQLSCAAFCLMPIYESATIPSIQALHLIGVYMFMTNRQNLEYRWLTTGLASRLMECAGLHRNSETWIQDDPSEHRRRNRVFWESYAWDVWQSFHTGRSPALPASHIQCKMPLGGDQTITEAASSYSAWKYQYRHYCLVPAMEEAFGVRSPSHATILRLDRKIRDFEVPSILRIRGLVGMPPDQNADLVDVPVSLILQRHAVFCELEITLLHLHRNHFSQALADSPTDPLRSEYSASVLATYRSASLIISATRDLSLKHPELVSRIWHIWSHIFSAATMLGNIVIRSPSCQLSPFALTELDVAASLLETRAVRRSMIVVPVVKQLKEKAQDVYKQYRRKVAAECESASRALNHQNLTAFTERPHFAPSDRSTSTGSLASQSSSNVSPSPGLPRPKLFPPPHPDNFENVLDYIDVSPNTSEVIRLNGPDPEQFVAEYGEQLQFHGISRNYSPWEG